jgi:hypothetical protein
MYVDDPLSKSGHFCRGGVYNRTQFLETELHQDIPSIHWRMDKSKGRMSGTRNRNGRLEKKDQCFNTHVVVFPSNVDQFFHELLIAELMLKTRTRTV